MRNITLELEPGADPIRGRIGGPDGPRQLFWGWLQLIEALHRLAEDEPVGGARTGEQETRPSEAKEEEMRKGNRSRRGRQ